MPALGTIWQRFRRLFGIRAKLIFLVMGVSLGSLLPLSMLVSWQLQALLLENTLDVCRNLAREISGAAKEELLLNNIYVNTREVMQAQQNRHIYGLQSAFVVYQDGTIVAHKDENRLGSRLPRKRLQSWRKLKSTRQETEGNTLRIVDPIFIRYREKDYWMGASVFEFDRREIFAPVRRLLQSFWLIALAVVLLALFSTIVFAGRMSRPIEALVEGARSIGAGNLGVRLEIHKTDEIGELGRTFNRMAHQIELSQKRTAQQAALQREMEIAENIQTSLLPASARLGPYEYHGFMQTADEVGGDYFDCIPIPPQGKSKKAAGWWFIIGDVSGHGLSAGLTMLMAQTAVQTVLLLEPNKAANHFFNLVNSVLYKNIKKLNQNRYMTAAFFKVNLKGQVQYAGLHLDIFVYRKKTGQVDVFPTDGLWLGIEEDLGRDTKTLQLKLSKGDLLFLFTDGLTEAMNAKQEMFSEKRLALVLEKHGSEDLKQIEMRIRTALEKFTNKKRYEDDITFLMIRKT